ncbi:hypothetical protein R1sor_015337 [Riccia sorocarpa]|uniref:BAH domain-containing protein n=1 Tax=Riccia sorocarpa TaxID=122646 RepID=A0ABD3HBX8_9MARC
MRQWRWRSPQDEDTSRSKQPPIVITSGDLAQRILGERRPAYASTRRARPGTSEHDHIHHIGDIKDLASGQMVAVLAEDDKSFWIAKVIDIKSMTIDGEPNEVEIQWFATKSTDPYVGKYYPEKKRDNGRGRATLFRQTLIFPNIRILAFDFSLTTTSRLRKTTVSQIRTQLFRLEQEVAVECGVDNADSPEDVDAGPENKIAESKTTQYLSDRLLYVSLLHYSSARIVDDTSCVAWGVTVGKRFVHVPLRSFCL